jgi:hypothetical protein
MKEPSNHKLRRHIISALKRPEAADYPDLHNLVEQKDDSELSKVAGKLLKKFNSSTLPQKRTKEFLDDLLKVLNPNEEKKVTPAIKESPSVKESQTVPVEEVDLTETITAKPVPVAESASTEKINELKSIINNYLKREKPLLHPYSPRPILNLLAWPQTLWPR